MNLSAEATDLCGALRLHARRIPDQTALLAGAEAISYHELDQSSSAVASWFVAQGFRPGDRVAVCWSNSAELVQLFFALFKAGLVVVTINTRLKPVEIRYILDHSQPRMCCCEPALAGVVEQAGAACPIITELPKAAMGSSAEPAPRDLEQAAVILYTSGTTAHPKGVVHTHRSLFRSAATWAWVMRDLPDSVLHSVRLCTLPLMHMAALTLLMGAIVEGATSVLLRFEPAAALDAIERFSCTDTVWMPALLRFVLEEQARKPRRLSSLRWIGVGGDAASLELQQRCEAVLGITPVEGFGMTELNPIACNFRLARRPGSIGKPVRGVEMKIVDLEGREVPEGETGELIVRSDSACAGYWNDPAATGMLLRGGWLHAGDLVSCDSDGYFWFRGRRKEIIVRAGSNISPQEVEEALGRHPAVLETGVVGFPDPVYGERVAAFITLRAGQAVDGGELKRFAQQYLADYKVPEEIRFLSELPKSATGKVHRRTLKETFVQ
jgi:long-chain acyl-CoA synthetase